MQIQFLGTGAGMPSKERNVTAIALKLLDEIGSIWLFDCGEATQHQILNTSIRPRRIDKIFITHLHGDHIFGLPGFLSSRSFLGGDSALTIFGPAGLQQYVEAALGVSKTHLTYPVIFVEIDSGVIYEDENFLVLADKLEHTIECFGYRILQKDLPGRLLIEKVQELGVPKGPLYRQLKNGSDVTLDDGTVVRSADVVTLPQKGFIVTILGDTKYSNSAIKLSENADIVVHEATFNHSTTNLAASYGHSTNMEAAHVATKANAKNLIMTHISARFLKHEVEALLAESRTIFANTFVAHDLQTFDFKNNRLTEG
ncbi:ribonuclease Z [Lysinibacillus sp. 54212]|uniref:ribonuclease Z n=1 Tax=Lysinibacillus sp. 54212 TaxID=3119829 RepID=UPI002FC9E1D3